MYRRGVPLRKYLLKTFIRKPERKKKLTLDSVQIKIETGNEHLADLTSRITHSAIMASLGRKSVFARTCNFAPTESQHD